MKKRPGTLIAKRNRKGYVFVAPFLAGFLLCFLIPLIMSMVFSFNNISMQAGSFTLEAVGIEHYIEAFTGDAEFPRLLVEAIQKMLVDLPCILIFSFFMANVLNQKFPGRGAARAIMFLPVIITSGVVLSLEYGNSLTLSMQNSLSSVEMEGVNLLRYQDIADFLLNTNLSASLVNFIISAIANLRNIINASGVQILVFIAGLQTIPRQLYEASSIEGATGWENFWKITFPMVSPVILVNTIYTIVDSFVRSDNQLINFINTKAQAPITMGYASALSWIYFLIIGVIIALVLLLISKKVVYQD